MPDVCCGKPRHVRGDVLPQSSGRSRVTTRVVVIVLALVAASRAATAQSTLGNIVGVVQDQSSLALPGAAVMLQSLDESATQSGVSALDGSFQFLNLKPGRYSVVVSLSGFADFSAKDIQLNAPQTFRVALTLAVGGVQETVSVVAEAPAINTESGTIADSNTFQQVTQLPVTYRGTTTSPLAALNTVVGVQQDNSGNISI